MTRQQAVNELTVGLTKAIGEWMRDLAGENDDALSEMGWIGHDVERLMAKAAMAALELSADAQDYLRREGHLKDD